MEYPTFEIVIGQDGQPVYRISASGLTVEHQQQWQAEAELQQLAARRGVTLPTGWYTRQLGFRSRPGKLT